MSIYFERTKNMLREMRRQDRKLSNEEAWKIIKDGNYGVLSLNGDDGYPYGVPMHYVLIDDVIYMHSNNKSGHKFDCIRRDSKMSFTVLAMEDTIKGKSTIIFGTINIIDNMKERVLEAFVETYVPSFAWDQAKQDIPYATNNMEVYSISIDKMSAKLVDKPDGK